MYNEHDHNVQVKIIFCTPDINECVVGGQALCDQECINMPGSFRCSCYEGYEPYPGRAKRCRDINECDLNLPDCHACTNLEGRYSRERVIFLLFDHYTCTTRV